MKRLRAKAQRAAAVQRWQLKQDRYVRQPAKKQRRPRAGGRSFADYASATSAPTGRPYND